MRNEILNNNLLRFMYSYLGTFLFFLSTANIHTMMVQDLPFIHL